VESLARERAEARDLHEGLQEREGLLRDRERTARDRAEEEARQLLLDARREVEEAIRGVRIASEAAIADKDVLDAANREARRRVEAAARKHRSERGRKPKPQGDQALSVGNRVSVTGTGSKGTVVEIRDGRAVVETSGVRLQVPTSDLVYLGPTTEKPKATGSAMASSWVGPEAEPETEVDVRGLRVSEVGLEVDRAVDQAILGGLGELWIIHGKGTGALRQSVAELLENDGRVSDYRMGGPAEGGAGVTVVKLR
jgi:DNA mismatch repair protein MutS2